MNEASIPHVSQPDDLIALSLGKLVSAQGLDLKQPLPLACDVQQWQTEEGARVHFVAAPERPMFDLVLRFRAGSVLDGNQPGLAALTLYSLDQGTSQLGAAEFAEQLEGLGAIMQRRISQDFALVTLRSLSMPGLRASALQLITDMIARPALRPADVEKIRERLVNSQHRRSRSPSDSLLDGTMEHLFKHHPYGTSPAGTVEGLANITLEHVTAFHRQAYSANNVDIALVGDLSREEAEALATSVAQALPQHWAAIPPSPLPTDAAQPLHLIRPGSNINMMITQPLLIAPADPSYPALLLANEILGSGLESRLSSEMRTRRALTYNISSTLQPMDAGTLWHISWDIAPEYRDASRDLVADVIGRFVEHGPTPAEHERALNQVTGSLLRATADNGQLAKGLAVFGQQGLPADHLTRYPTMLAALTQEDIRLAARDWLDVDQAFFATLGPTVGQQFLPEPPTIGE